MRLSTRGMTPKYVSYTYDVAKEKRYQLNRRLNSLIRGDRCDCEQCKPNTTGVTDNGTRK